MATISGGYIHRENLMIALHLAIESKRNESQGITASSNISALEAGWQSVLDDLEQGKHVEIKG